MIILLWSRRPSRELAEPAGSTPCCKCPEVGWPSHCGDHLSLMRGREVGGHEIQAPSNPCPDLKAGIGGQEVPIKKNLSEQRGHPSAPPGSLPFLPELFFRATVSPFRSRVTIIDTARCFPTCGKALACLDVAGHWLPASGCGTCIPGVPLLSRLQPGLPAQRCEQAERWAQVCAVARCARQSACVHCFASLDECVPLST